MYTDLNQLCTQKLSDWKDRTIEQSDSVRHSDDHSWIWPKDVIDPVSLE